MTNGNGNGHGPRASPGSSDPSTRERTNEDRDYQFRALVEAVEEYAIFRLDPEGTVVSWNTGAERIKGYSAAEIVGRHFSTFYTDDDRAAGVPERNLAAAVDNGSVEDEGWRVRADGSRFWANVTITAIRGDDGDLEGFAKVTRDMTDRKRAEEEHQLHVSVSHSLAEAASLEEGLLAVLEEVCQWTDWEVGQAWLPTDDGVAKKLPISYVQSDDFAPFVDESSVFAFEPGEGIPGRVLDAAESVWFPDVTAVSEEIYPRTALAAEMGVKAGLGVPVLADGDVAVILEFYMTERREMDDRLVEVVSAATADLGGLVSRRQAEDELDRERQLLGEMMEAAPVGISVLSADGDVQRMNERAAVLHGRPANAEQPDADSRTYYDEEGSLVPFEERPFALVRETGEPLYDWTAQIEHPDGQRKWLSVDAAPIETDDGELDRVVLIEEDLSELGERYRAIMEAINDVIVTIDETSTIRSVNPAVEDVFGYGRGDLIGEPLTRLMPEEYREKHHAAISRYLETGDQTLDWEYLELPGLRADGTEIPLAVSFSEIRYRGERYFTGVLRDISERKAYQRRIEESNERLEQFAYAASHDLQEPLRMVSSYLQLIERRYGDDLDADGQEFLDYAVDGAERMRDMIDGLLEYSRVETRGDPLEPVELDAVLADVRDDLQVKIREHDAEITAESLPRVEGDSDQLRQVFQNLLDNAVEYSGDEPPRVRIEAERSGDEWVLSVSDEGVGIESGDVDRIFEVFQSLHTPEEGGGTGIGLALVKRIVERHGGEIRVDSEPSEGTTFSFTLPAADDGER
ncbi:PAS domain S-box protein [Halopiger aswanensis]|uniref:histidine kinase n=1 Tax=Halopiger aswanensis TaxID=148449 RepID=A0A3R7HGH4_9EURY|nr:PAS domain S-box protein [Halopiger aswanensis]RKD89144.1 PAS domain S-box-containing protein [Halopiger aswanensis]